MSAVTSRAGVTSEGVVGGAAACGRERYFRLLPRLVAAGDRQHLVFVPLLDRGVGTVCQGPVDGRMGQCNVEGTSLSLAASAFK